MGNGACAWFGVNPSTAQVVGSVLKGKNMLQFDHTDTDNLGCQLLRNYLVILAVTVFWTSDRGYCFYFQFSNRGFWQEEQEK